jgi:hypothetical protein
VADWNRILFALNQSNGEDDVEFEEFKTVARFKTGIRSQQTCEV